jgi:AraC-like DNA-binding protein
MRKSQTISFSELAESMEQVHADRALDFSYSKAKNKALGSLEKKTLHSKFFGINELKADFTGNFRIAFNEDQMLHNMNICIALDGNVSLDLKESNLLTSLSPLKHHCVYSHETDYDLIINKSVHVIHITIDREYYAGLLGETERTSAVMKEKLMNKDQVWSGTGDVNLAMKRTVEDMLCNSLQGNLKTLFTEAKILELVALQLNFFDQGPLQENQRSRDDDTFYGIRKYLDEHFMDDLSLRMLSRMFGVNEYKLKRGFKELFNSTVFDYIHELKMTHAHMLLRDKYYVSEVASTVGYKNANHFSTAFKRKFGVSPTALK